MQNRGIMKNSSQPKNKSVPTLLGLTRNLKIGLGASIFALASCNAGVTNSNAPGDNVSANAANASTTQSSSDSPEYSAIHSVSYNIESFGASSQSIIYKNGFPLAFTNNGNSGVYTADTFAQMSNVSPMVVDDHRFIMTNREGIVYSDLGVIVPGNKGVFGWKTIPANSIKTGAGAVKQIYSPLVQSVVIDKLTSESNLFLVVRDQGNYLQIIRSAGGKDDVVGTSWQPISKNAVYVQQPSSTPNNIYDSPLAVGANNSGIFFFTAGQNNSKPQGDVLLNIDTFSNLVATPETGLPTGKGLRILAITYSANQLYVLYSNGSLYSADMTNYDTDRNASLTFTSRYSEATSSLCIGPMISPIAGVVPIQVPSNIMAATESGVDICQKNQVFQAEIDSNNNYHDTTIPLPSGATGIALATSNAHDLAVVVESNNTQQVLKYDLSHGDFKSLISKYNFPVSTSSNLTTITSVGFDDHGRAYLATYQKKPFNDLVLTGDYTNDVNWVSLGAKFNLTLLEASKTKIGYTGYANNSKNLGHNHVLAITDGKNWFGYSEDSVTYGDTIQYLGSHPIAFPGGDSNDQVAQIGLSYSYIYVMTQNGYVLQHSNTPGDGSKWSVVYNPSVAYAGVNYGKATKLLTTPNENGAFSELLKDGLTIITQDASNNGHLLWLEQDMNIMPFPGAESMNIADAQITNTTPYSAGFNDSALIVADKYGALYQKPLANIYQNPNFTQMSPPESDVAVSNLALFAQCTTPTAKTLESMPGQETHYYNGDVFEVDMLLNRPSIHVNTTGPLQAVLVDTIFRTIVSTRRIGDILVIVLSDGNILLMRLDNFYPGWFHSGAVINIDFALLPVIYPDLFALAVDPDEGVAGVGDAVGVCRQDAAY